MEAEELFNKGLEMQTNLQGIMGVVQNTGMVFSEDDREKFDYEVKELIKGLGIWKMDVLMYMETTT